MSNQSRNIIISTGNILNINRKAGQKTSEEVRILIFIVFGNLANVYEDS